VVLDTVEGPLRYDALILACHADQAVRLLGNDITPDEQAVLSAIPYQPNTAVLHTDARVLPRRQKAWAAWNYERAVNDEGERQRVCLHYLINRLQPLPWQTPVVVSLNPLRPIDPARVLKEIQYAHPVFDLAAMRAQARVPELQGRRRTWFCGAWCGYGFHEDGLKAGLSAASALVQALPRLARDPVPVRA
jgi:predicted NAD/FAD-binding protein